MVTRHHSGGSVWIDLERPTQDEIKAVSNECGLGEKIEREIQDPTPTPIVIPEHGAVLLVLHFPAAGGKDSASSNDEVDFIVGKDFVITVHYETLAIFHELHKLFEADELLGTVAFASDELLEFIMAKFLGSLRNQINHATHSLERIERDMFSGRERTTVRDLLASSRSFLHVESTLASQEEPLSGFLKVLARKDLFGESFEERAQRILLERDQVARLLASHRAIATELRETNIALLNATQNEIMKTLTVITFLMLPLGVIAGIFGMNVAGTPLTRTPDAFWIIVGLMALLTVGLITIFARKRWL